MTVRDIISCINMKLTVCGSSTVGSTDYELIKSRISSCKKYWLKFVLKRNTIFNLIPIFFSSLN